MWFIETYQRQEKRLQNKSGDQMKAFVGVTDNEWFAFLSQQQEIDEINFLQSHVTG